MAIDTPPQNPVKRFVVWGLLLVGTAVCLTACGAERISPVSSASQDLDIEAVHSMPEKLGCENTRYLFADVYYPDWMKGFDCKLTNSGGQLTVRVYEHSDSIPQALAGWQNLISEDLLVSVGTNWFIVGPTSSHETFTLSIGVETTPESALVVSPEPLPLKVQQISSCAAGMVALSRIATFDEALGDLGYETMFPGISEKSADLSLKVHRPNMTPLDFEYVVTEYAEEIFDFCVKGY